MQKENIAKFFLACLLLFVTFNVQAVSAKEGEDKGGKVDTEEEINAYIDHHLQDSYYFNFFSDGETGAHYGFPLPVILWDDGLKVFSSGKFHHGEDIAMVDGQYYRLYHSKIYRTDAEGNIVDDEGKFYGMDGVSKDAEGNLLSGQGDEKVSKNDARVYLDFSITKNVLTMILVSILMFWIFTSLAKTYKKRSIPRKFGRVLEPLVLYVRDEIAKPNIGKNYRKYSGFLLTVFFFIWILNLLGMTPLGVNVTGNIAVTFALALITFFIVQFSGNKDYWKHIFWMPGVPLPMKIVLAPIEVLGMFTKPFALMIRLFANITAGHVIIMTLVSLIVVYQNWIAGPAFFGFTIFISIIELLVAFLQAYIFTLLSALYIGMAVEEHDHEHPADNEDIPVL